MLCPSCTQVYTIKTSMWIRKLNFGFQCFSHRPNEKEYSIGKFAAKQWSISPAFQPCCPTIGWILGFTQLGSRQFGLSRYWAAMLSRCTVGNKAGCGIPRGCNTCPALKPPRIHSHHLDRAERRCASIDSGINGPPPISTGTLRLFGRHFVLLPLSRGGYPTGLWPNQGFGLGTQLREYDGSLLLVWYAWLP
jgi:hypothetical protein